MIRILWFALLFNFHNSRSGHGAEQPSMALLEFLGEWEDQQGNLANPFDYTKVEENLNPQRQEQAPQQNGLQNNEQ